MTTTEVLSSSDFFIMVFCLVTFIIFAFNVVVYCINKEWSWGSFLKPTATVTFTLLMAYHMHIDYLPMLAAGSVQ